MKNKPLTDLYLELQASQFSARQKLDQKGKQKGKHMVEDASQITESNKKGTDH